MDDISIMTKDQDLYLNQGDTLLLFFDGIVEARNVNKKMFEFTRLRQIFQEKAFLSDELLLEAVIEKTLEWSGNKHEDDMTIIVLRRK